MDKSIANKWCLTTRQLVVTNGRSIKASGNLF
jgi:hypothetical protein